MRASTQKPHWKLYSKEDNQQGISKTMELISRINDCLEVRGDEDYTKAIDYYTDALSLIDSGMCDEAMPKLDNALIYVQRANNSYIHISPPNSERIEKCNSLRNNIIEARKGCEISYADSQYIKALQLMEPRDILKKDCVGAKDIINNILPIYQSYNHQEGIDNCNALLAKIADCVRNIRIHADLLYDKAIEAFGSANCSNENYLIAIEKLREAKGLYEKIRYQERVDYCEHLIKQINEELQGCISEMEKQAEDYYYNAKTYKILERNLTLAMEYLNRSIRIYQNLYNLTNNKLKMQEYLARIKECNILYNEILEIIYQNIDVENAWDMVEEAKYRIASATSIDDYRYAKDIIENASKIFEKYNRYDGIDECERVNDTLEEIFSLIDLANQYYNKSDGYYRIAEYENATHYLNKSKLLYNRTKLRDEIEKCNELGNKILEGVRKKEIARNRYNEAINKYNERLCLDARMLADEALRIYTDINFSSGINETKKLIKEIERGCPSGINPHVKDLAMSMMAFVLLALLKWQIDKQKIMRRLEEEERRRREEEERRRREEEERRRREEEERRRRLEEERRLIKELLEKERGRFTEFESVESGRDEL